MATSVIHDLRPSFKERNEILFLLLGVRSLTSRWLRLVEREVSAAQQAPPAQDFHVHLPPDEGLLFFLLGTISFSHNLAAVLETASQRLPGEPAAEAGRRAWSDLLDLLR